MKRWLSTILSIALVIGMVSILHACGKSKPKGETTSAAAVTEWSDEEDEDVSSDESNTWVDFWEMEDEDNTERTTNEHYQEEYDALTLPMAVTTQSAGGTTNAQATTNPGVRETTTQFQFQYQSGKNTTKKDSAAGGTTAAAEKGSTTKADGTTKAATTAASAADDYQPPEDVIGSSIGGVREVTAVPRPQVTNLDKYVIEVFNSGSFTMEMDVKQDGNSLPVVVYTNSNNTAFEMTMTNFLMTELQLPSSLLSIGKVRFIIRDKTSSNPKAYITWPAGYTQLDNVGDVTDLVGDMQDENSVSILSQLSQAGLEYCGLTYGAGYVCETYVNNEEHMQYNFYFSKVDNYEGLVRWDRVDLNTKQTDTQIVMRLMKGVNNGNAFTPTGVKMSMEEVEKMFS